MTYETIYGVKCPIPQVPKASDIMNFGMPKHKQKWYRHPVPAIFDELEFDENDDPIYTDTQIKWIDGELEKFEKGIWFYNNGKATYITGLHYFYLRYWILENMDAPEYRETGRRWFLFQKTCESYSHVDGIIRAKKRREGATSEATADQVLTAISVKAAFCGIISKTSKDAKDVFLKMIRPAFNALPIMFKPDAEDDTSKTEIYFIRNKRKTRMSRKAKVKRTVMNDNYGLGSRIETGTTALNTFDSGRQTKPLIDEGGKFPPDVPINEYWPIIRKTLKIGAKRVGFALLPSTCNKLTKGGKGFKMLWDDSNQFLNKITGTGLYRYFTPGDEGYEPYIDEYGQSITEKPTVQQAKWMREHYGASDLQCSMSAKEWILYSRSLIRDPEALKEEIRMCPLNEAEAFDYEDGDNIYDVNVIAAQKEYLKENPPVQRRVSFFRKENDQADWRDDPKGMWLIDKFPLDEEVNQKVSIKGVITPANTSKYVLVADPFKNTVISGKGSNAAAIIGSKINPLDPENTGAPMAFFLGRPKLRRQFHLQMLLAAEYFGCQMAYESDYDDYIEFLESERVDGHNRMGYAMLRPENTYDPNRKTKAKKQKEFGMKSGDGFTYSMMIDRSQVYVNNYCYKIRFMDLLDDLEIYNHEERTLHDPTVALQLFSVAISEPVREKKEKPKPRKLIRTHKVQL